MHERCASALTLAAVVTFALVDGAAAGERRDAVVAKTPHFAFYSDLATNVHDALLEAGRHRRKGGPELFRSGEGADCFTGLAASERTAWNLAVDYYAEVVSPKRFSDRQQFLIRLDLAGLEEFTRERDRRYVEIARGLIQAATPAYERCRWEIQGGANRSWIEALLAGLKDHEGNVARRLGKLYAKSLAGLPMRVDVVETVNWSGATTWILDPAGGHIVISNVEPGPISLEYLFHEASHTLMAREDPVRVVLRQAAQKRGVQLPGDLWHAVLFYTTGDAVSRALAEAGDPDYTPMIFQGNIFSHHHQALRRAWESYLDGQLGLERAAENLIRELEPE